MKRLLVFILVALTLILLLNSCGYSEVELTEARNAGYAEGSKAGYDKGYNAGLTEAWKAGYDKGSKAGYDKGYNAGLAQSQATAKVTPQIDKPSFSNDEVLAIVSTDKENGFNLWLKTATTSEDLGIDIDSGRWSTSYLGEGKWEVRLVFTNVEGVWYFYEKSQTVEFWGRLRH